MADGDPAHLRGGRRSGNAMHTSAARGLLVLVLLAWTLVTAGRLVAAVPAHAGGTGSLDLVDQAVDVDEDTTWWARVRASGAEGANTVVATVFEALPDRDAYLDSTARGELGGAIARLNPVEVDTAGGVVTVNLTPEDRERIRMVTPAVHPVLLTLLDDEGDVLDELVTYAVLADRQTPSMPVALVLPFGLPPRIATDGSSQVSGRDEQQLAVIVDALSSHSGIPVTVRATPETLVALDASGAQRLLTELRDALAEREIPAATFVDTQPAGWFASGIGEEFAGQLAAGEATLTDFTAQLPRGDVWLADPTLDPAAVDALAGLGFGNFAIPDLTERTSLVEVAGTTAPHAAITVDSRLAGHIGSTGDPVLDAHRVLADLAMIGSDAADAGAVILPPADWTPSDPFLNAILDGLEESVAIDPVTLSGLFEELPGPQGTATLDGPAPDPLGSYPQRLDEVTNEVNGLSSLLPEADDVVADLRTVLLTSGSAELTIFQREAYLATVSDAVAALTPVVTATDGRRVTMTGRSGVIPVGLDNQSGRPVRVAVQLRSDKLEFPDGSVMEVELAEGLNQLEIPVTARTSGDSTLELEVLSPDQSLELSSASVTVRSTALSGIGLMIAAVALLILLVWWIRNFRTGRRDRRLVEVGGPPDPDGSPTGGD